MKRPGFFFVFGKKTWYSLCECFSAIENSFYHIWHLLWAMRHYNDISWLLDLMDLFSLRLYFYSGRAVNMHLAYMMGLYRTSVLSGGSKARLPSKTLLNYYKSSVPPWIRLAFLVKFSSLKPCKGSIKYMAPPMSILQHWKVCDDASRCIPMNSKCMPEIVHLSYPHIGSLLVRANSYLWEQRRCIVKITNYNHKLIKVLKFYKSFHMSLCRLYFNTHI